MRVGEIFNFGMSTIVPCIMNYNQMLECTISTFLDFQNDALYLQCWLQCMPLINEKKKKNFLCRPYIGM